MEQAQNVKEATKLRPVGNRVLVKRREAQQQSGNIILPDSAKQKQEQETVIEIGTGKKDKAGKTIEIPVKVGDTILMDKYSGQEVKIDDEELIIVRADDIIAIIEE